MELLKLVIVDDEPILLEGLLKTYDWAGMGFEVVGSARDGDQAIQVIKDKKPNVVLTDIRMKKVSGLQVMQEIEKEKIYCLFVVLSAYRDFEYAKQACDLGAFAYLLKPINDDELRQTMCGAYESCILERERLRSGMLQAYRQQESGFTIFTLVPNTVLNRGMTEIALVLLVIYLVVIIIAMEVSFYISKIFTKPILMLSKEMEQFDGKDFSRTVKIETNTELDKIGNSYNEMLQNIENLLNEIKKQEKELRTSELNMLINQIKPHFLYNTLDTIYMLARINGEKTTMKMIQSLSTYLRLSLSKGKDIVTVGDELENVQSYMEILQIRNSGLFTYEIDCQVEKNERWILKLILQPLVENAIKYGFADMEEGGIIRIEVKELSGKLTFTVYNNGIPMDSEMVDRINSLSDVPVVELKEVFPDKKHGYGVVNIITRLRLKYGDEVRFYYEIESCGTRCIIQLPESGKENDEI